MTIKPLVMAATVSAAMLAGCATTYDDMVPATKYNSEIAKRDAELSRLRAAAGQPQGFTVRPVGGLTSELFPPNAKAGHCYARLLTPAEYRETSERVLVKDASERVEVIPAEFEWVEEKVITREAATRLEVIPATYKEVTEQVLVKPATKKYVPYDAEYETVTEQVLVKQASTELVPVDAEYETVTEQILDKPAHTVWKRGSGFRGEALKTSVDQSTGEIMCLVEVPATYKTVTKTILKVPATTRVVEIPAEYDTVTRKVMKRPAGVTEVVIPAEYETVTKTVIDTAATTREIEIPAEYGTVKVRKMVREATEKRIKIPAEYSTVAKREKISEERLNWAEVICRDNINTKLVTRLQNTLKDYGHYQGPIDGLYGPATRKALNTYADAEGLTKGSNYIPLDTAMALGIKL